MSNYNLILARLNVYPSLRQINEALSYAKEITVGYVRKFDPNAVVTVDDDEIDIYTNSNFKDIIYHAQSIFDEAFFERIEKIQAEA